jgi:hypothetical protein
MGDHHHRQSLWLSANVSPNGGFMFDGVFQAFHLIILLVMVMIVAVGMFPVFRALWHHGSRNSNRLRRGIHVTQ